MKHEFRCEILREGSGSPGPDCVLVVQGEERYPSANKDERRKVDASV